MIAAARLDAFRASLEQRLVAAVRRRLGSDDVRLQHWDRCARTGAEIPVFAVPASLVDAARAAGLTVADARSQQHQKENADVR